MTNKEMQDLKKICNSFRNKIESLNTDNINEFFEKVCIINYIIKQECDSRYQNKDNRHFDEVKYIGAELEIVIPCISDLFNVTVLWFYVDTRKKRVEARYGSLGDSVNQIISPESAQYLDEYLYRKWYSKEKTKGGDSEN